MARLYRAYVAAREASEAGAGADRDRAAPIPGDNPVDRVRAILQEARNHFADLEDAAETLPQPSWSWLETAFTSPCANIFALAMASVSGRCRPRSWATGCAGTIITAAN